MTLDMYYFSLHEKYQEKYKNLKQKFIEIASLHINAVNLQVLKQFYDDAIDSKRASDNIRDLQDLVKILEKRLVLSYHNIEPLKHIASTLVGDPVLDQAIKEYELQLYHQEQLPPLNVYKCRSGEYLSGVNDENSSVVIKANPSEESSVESEDSQLIHSHVFHDNSQLSAEILLNKKNSDQIVSLPPSTSNTNRHIFMHILNLNFSYNIATNFHYKYIILRAILVLVVLVVFYSIIIEITLKSSVLPIPSVSSTSSIRDDSRVAAPTQIVLLNHSTALLQNQQPLQSVSNDQEKSNKLIALQTEVFQYLSENLGRSWRDLARFLDVKEAEIDSIDLKEYRDYKNMAAEALEIFRKRCDPYNWKKKLITSLETVRRRDLAEHITDMILQSDDH